jgi:cell division protein FtsN
MSTKKHSDANNTKSYTNKEQWEDDLDLPPIGYKKESIKKPILEKAAFDKNRKKSKRIPMLILLVAGLALIIGTYFIFRESKNEKLQQATNKEDLQIVDNETKIIEQVEDSAVIEVKKEPEIQEESVIIEEIEESIDLQDEEMEYEGPKNYHIVVGSFKNDAYAQNWLDKTAYGEIDIQYIREYDGWYRVILFSYSSNEQAEITLDAVRNDLKLKAWIAYMN